MSGPGTVSGLMVGPVLGPESRSGRGFLRPHDGGLDWSIKRRFRGEITGTVSWAEVTKVDVGVQRMGSSSAVVAIVKYGPMETGPGAGFLMLQQVHLPVYEEVFSALADRFRLFVPPDRLTFSL